MGSSDDYDPDDRLLDELYERAVADAQGDTALDLDAWIVGREHLRARAEAIVAEGREAALFAPRRAAVARPGVVPGHTVLEEVGHGGMGSVFRARQESLGRIVALKVLSPALRLSPRARARFQLEARALSRLRHPNVVAVYEVLPDSDVCAYTMEWIDGVTLAAKTAAVGQPRDVRAIAVLGETLARALAAVHAAGLVHRDVKPSNVVLRDDGAPVLIDFGLVRDLDQGQATESGEFLGTAAFAAPEQLRGAHARVGPWTDVYGLGVTLYNSLAGRTPYSTTSTLALLHDIENGLGESLHRVAPGVPRDLAVIITKAIAPEPERRYATATELADDLARYLAGLPILARPASRVERGARWVRRNPWPTAALVILAAGLAATARLAYVAEVRAADNKELAFNNAASARAEADARRAATESANTASARAAELERVLAFREGQWESVDSEALGQGLRAALLARVRDGDREALTTGLTGVNLTDVALDVLRAQLFDRERAAIATGFTGEPLVAARLLQGLADPLRALGLLDAALGPQREALELRRAHHGAQHIETLESSQALGALLLARGELAEAEQVLADTLALVTATLDEAHPLTLSTRRTHAEVIRARGRLFEAEPLFAQVALAHVTHLGADHLDTLSFVVQHAALLLELGRAVEARALLAPALESLDVVAGPEDRATLAALETLATSHAWLGEHDEAERLRNRVVATRSRLLGDDHPETIRAERLLAQDYLELGRFADAHALLSELRERCTRVLGPAHAETIATLSQYAGVAPDEGYGQEHLLPLLELALAQAREVLTDEHDATLRIRGVRAEALTVSDRSAEGVAEAREALAVSRRVFGDHYEGTLERLEVLVKILTWMSTYGEAKSLARELVDGRRTLHGPEHPRTLVAERTLGLLLMRNSELADAERIVRHAAEGLRAILGPEHDETLTTHTLLGEVLRFRGDFAASEAVLREVLDARLRSRGEQSLLTARARYALATLLLTQGHEDEALELGTRVLEVRRRVLGSEHEDTLEALSLLSGIERSRGRLDVAAQYQYEVLEVLRRRPGVDPKELHAAANGLCVTLLNLGRPYEAIQYCREALELSDRAFEPDDALAWGTRGNLAGALQKIGDLAEAEALYRDVLAGLTSTLGRLNTRTAMSHHNLGSLLVETQRPVEAEGHFVAALEVYLALLDPMHQFNVDVRTQLGNVLLQGGRHSEALAVLAPVEDAARAHFVGSRWRALALYLSYLGRAHHGPDANRDWPTAESYLLEAHAICAANLAGNAFEVRFATQRVSEMYDAWNEAEPSDERVRLCDAWRARLAAFDGPAASTAGPSEPK